MANCKDYFRFPFSFSRIIDNYFVIELGAPYEEVRNKLRRLNEERKAEVTFFGDLSIEGVSKATGLNLLMAGFAKQGEYSETLIHRRGQEALGVNFGNHKRGRT